MCQYTFPLCDNITGQLYLPTQGECVRVSEQVCQHEWNLTRELGYGDMLPDCTTLPPNGIHLITCTCTSSEFCAVPQNLSCRDDFIRLNGSCQPRCDRFEQHGHTTILLNRVIRLTAAILAVIGGIGFLVASAMRYKQM